MDKVTKTAEQTNAELADMVLVKYKEIIQKIDNAVELNKEVDALTSFGGTMTITMEDAHIIKMVLAGLVTVREIRSLQS